MTTVISAVRGSDWRNFIRNHWGVVAVFVVAASLALVGAVYMF